MAASLSNLNELGKDTDDVARRCYSHIGTVSQDSSPRVRVRTAQGREKVSHHEGATRVGNEKKCARHLHQGSTASEDTTLAGAAVRQRRWLSPLPHDRPSTLRDDDSKEGCPSSPRLTPLRVD